ncbi:MAG: putative metal-binding motif-containing protein, partial [Patescibacteria group bacterium]
MNFWQTLALVVIFTSTGCLPTTAKLSDPDWDTAIETDTDTDTDSDTDSDTDTDTDSDTDTDPDPDGDGDGYPASTDCDDTDRDVHPGADELCDTIDNNCVDGIDEPGAVDGTAYYIDDDGDGHGLDGTAQTYCADPGVGFSLLDDDCDDGNEHIHPDMIEVCDNLTDDDCDTQIDEELDDDGDTYTNCDMDCDDTRADVFPGADEYCDGVDNDCDTFTDEEGALDGTPYYVDADT